MASRKGGVLTLRMFAGHSKTGRQSLLAQTENIISGGFVEEPAWLQNMRRHAPAHPPRDAARLGACAAPRLRFAARRLTRSRPLFCALLQLSAGSAGCAEGEAAED